jgi:hypothetical protein
MGLFGGSSKSETAKSSATSGIGNFAPVNNISYSSGLIDLDITDPFELAGLSIILIAGYIAWKRL